MLGVGMTSRSSSIEGASSAPAAEAPASRAEPAGGKDSFEEPLRELEASLPPTKGLPRRVVVALVPDPIDSVLDDGFDRALDGIRRAASSAGYHPDRAWLPWSDDRRANSGGGKAINRARTTPGRMLFRNDQPGDTRSAILDVVLVGETVAWGLHAAAFDKALAHAADAGEIGSLRILGPTFSGTAPSLRAGLDRFVRSGKMPPEGVVIANGSATSADLAGVIVPPGQPIRFESLIPDDAEMLKAFSRWLVAGEYLEESEHGRVAGRTPTLCYVNDLAVLSEVGTAYGTTAGDLLGFGAVDRVCAPGGDLLHRTCYYRHNPPACAGYVPTLLVGYPLHVAYQRAAHERERKDRDGKSGEAEAPSGPRALDLKLDREPAAEQSPPLSAKTVHTDELQLAQTLSEMCRQEMRWIGIQGTDAADRLYLALALKERCPNVRLFFLAGDILYTHPRFSRALDGSLVISPYPLLLQNAAWSPPFETDTIAASSSAMEQGVANALLALLHEPALMKEHQRPFCRTGRSAPTRHAWITAVGNGAFWPVAVLDAGREREQRREQAGASACEGSIHAGRDARWLLNSTSQWRGAHNLFALAAAALALGYWSARVRPLRSAPPFGLGWAMRAFPRPDNAPSIRQTAWTLVALAPAAAVYLAILVTTFIEHAVNDGRLVGAIEAPLAWNLWRVCAEHYRGVIAALIAAALVLAVVDAPVTAVLSRWRSPGARAVLRRALAVDAILVAAPAVALGRRPGINPFSRGDAYEAVTSAILFRERNGNFSSGLSIFLPVILVATAAFVFGWVNLRRLGPTPPNAAERVIPSALPSLPLVFWFDADMRRLRGGLAMLAVAVLFILSARAPFASLTTLEHHAWGTALLHGGTLLFFGALAAFIAFILGWRSLRAVLRQWSSLPLADAFGRVPARYRQQLSGFFRARPPSLAEIGITVRQAAGVIAALPTAPGDAVGFGFLDRVPADRRADLAALRETIARAYEADHEAGDPTVARDATLTPTYNALCDLARRLADITLAAPRAPAGPDGAAKPAGAAWIEDADAVIATVLTAQVLHAMARLRSLITLAVITLVLLLAMLSAYPFEPRAALLWFVQVAIVIVATGAVVVFMEMERSEILSRLQDGTPGKVEFNRDLALKLTLYAVVPIFSIVATEVPALGEMVFHGVLPLIQTLR